MRALITLIASLILAGVVLLILAAAGLVRFTPENADRLSRNQDRPDLKDTVQAGPDHLRLQVSDLTLESGVWMEAAGIAETESALDRIEEPDHDVSFEAALDYLTGWNEEPSGQNLEKALRAYLLTLGVSPDQVEKTAGMCFWRGFVTLQQVNSKQDMQDKFELELELKQAAFAAQGLMLDEEIIADARQRLEELVDAHSAAGGRL